MNTREITAQKALEASIAFKRRIATEGAMRDVMTAMARLSTMVDAPAFNEASCKLIALRNTLQANNWTLDWGTKS